MGRLITIDNLTFNYTPSDSEGYVDDETNLGFNFMTFSPSMAKAFLKEMGDDVVSNVTGRNRKFFPHEDPYRVDDYIPGSEHDCYNSDTQIVFMHHFFNKNRKYQIDYRGLDVYWLFHDSRHAISDVYGNEVSGINSYREHERLIEGAELAQMHGYSMNGLTLLNLQNAWNSRWRMWEGSSMQKFDANYFYKMLSDFEKRRYELLTEFGDGEPRIIPNWEIEEYINELNWEE